MSRFGRKLARLKMPGATETVESADAPASTAAPTPPNTQTPSEGAESFARAGRPLGRGWDLDAGQAQTSARAPAGDGIRDESDAISHALDAMRGDSDAISHDSDAISDAMARPEGAIPEDARATVGAQGPAAQGLAPRSAAQGLVPRSAADGARMNRIARLQARIDAMVGRRQNGLRSELAEAGRRSEARTRAAPAGAWGRLARGAAEHARPAEPAGPARDPDDFSGVPGALEETDHGPIHVVSEVFDPDHCHGHAPVGPARAVPAAEVARFALDAELADVDMSRALYVDTETTGLYGSGTVPFLIGLGWFEGEQFHLRQLFLRRLGEERPMLGFLSDRLARASCIVTYNGKSFDWPLLCQRFVMNRLPPPETPLHLDLLHCARRAYKKRLGGARLVHIEEQVLGMTRVDDTPGHEIPLIYLDFVRGGPADRVAGIIEHNAHDIVAMAALLGRLAQRFARAHRDDDPRDLLSYARIAARAGDAERAAEFARVAAERATGGHAADAWLFHADLARKRRDWDTAEQGLEAALAEAVDDEQSGAAHLALAKLFEHRRKDFDRALRHAYHTRWMEGSAAWQKRIDRIERKRARAAGG